MKKLKKYLEIRGISSRKFAERLGTSPNNLGNLVNGKSCPSLRMAYRIEQCTNGKITLYDWVQEDWLNYKEKGKDDDADFSDENNHDY